MGKRSHEIARHFDPTRIIIGAEIGVRFGKNAEQLLGLLPRLDLLLVDRWEKPPAGDSFYNSGDGIAQRPAGHLRKAYYETLRRTELYKDRRHIKKMSSADAAAQIPDRTYDFVFLDADHSYDGVKSDIINWLPKVKIGGILCGHDYNHPRIGEVKKAVDELFSDIELGEDMTWFYIRRV